MSKKIWFRLEDEEEVSTEVRYELKEKNKVWEWHLDTLIRISGQD